MANNSCRQCGTCCKEETCQISVDGFGGYISPCPALEYEEGLFYCGLITRPSKYIDLGVPAKWKDRMVSGLFCLTLGIGEGCDSDLDDGVDNKTLNSDSKGDCNEK